MRLSRTRSLGAALLLGLAACGGAPSQRARTGSGGDGESTSTPLPPPDARRAAPGFDGATRWLNVDHPLSLEELRGRVVIVDFWTSCCINCLHTLPVLRRVEEAFAGDPVVVVGVHSPKFEEEENADRLRDTLDALAVTHPVAVDADMDLWRGWDVHAWPTVLVLDPQGRVVWSRASEPSFAELSGVVRGALREGRQAGELATAPLAGLSPRQGHDAPLRFPGDVLALDDGRLAVADTGHHRVVLLGPGGRVTDVVGSGRRGRTDGSFETAAFDSPQGLARVGGTLFVADTENHLVRVVDEKTRTVTTLAGTGALGRGAVSAAPVPARSAALRSPWALLPFRGNLLVALAGSHQIAELDLTAATLRAFAGNGREARVDGPLADASFAQPSALATDGREVFVLDSETSSVRAIDVEAGLVRTVVGKDLFVFGDVDGERERARLQHPLGLAFADGALWVADTYNSKIKRVDPRTGYTASVLGSGPGGPLSEPAGLTFLDGELVIADAHHHRLVIANPAQTPLELTPLETAGLAAPGPIAPRAVAVDPRDPVVDLGTFDLARAGSTELSLTFKTPAGTKLTPDGPARLTWVEADGLRETPTPVRTRGDHLHEGLTVTVVPRADADAGRLTGVLQLVICDADGARVCLPVRRTLRADLRVKDPPARRAATIPLPPAR